jgi:preprotein translocase subunit YajC
MALKISEEAAVQMPMKTVASLICMVAIGTWAYFGIIETQNKISTTLELMEKDLTENTEFRIKWPRGQLGSLPADSEQFMMIEDLYKTTEKIEKHLESMALNKVNIEFLRKQMDKVLEDIEELKDANREIHYKNGSNFDRDSFCITDVCKRRD